jgi:hypothetical protein
VLYKFRELRISEPADLIRKAGKAKTLMAEMIRSWRVKALGEKRASKIDKGSCPQRVSLFSGFFVSTQIQMEVI